MGRVNDDKWLDEALDKAIHSDDTRPNFENWKANHPEAVKSLTARTPQTGQTHRIRRIIMNGTLVKLAAAAVIAIAGVIGIYGYSRRPEGYCWHETLVQGPKTHKFADGSTVRLAEGAEIVLSSDRNHRGFRHVAGQIEVTVAKHKGEFIVTTPCGDVKALGTQFTMDLIDGMAEDTRQAVKLLNVEVTEGAVEVRNSKGVQTLKPMQNAVVAMDAAPYDFSQDPGLPEGLRQRIAAMVRAFETADRAAWAANFNMDYFYRLGKGEVPYDPNLFGGSAEDVEGIKQAVANVSSVEELRKLFLEAVDITEPLKVYVRSVELSADGKHARAECVRRESDNHLLAATPQWHNFDDGWWQIDD